MSSRVKRNRAECLRCGDVIESKHRHDFRECTCGAVGIHGGKGIVRIELNIKGKLEDHVKMLTEFEEEEELPWPTSR